MFPPPVGPITTAFPPARIGASDSPPTMSCADGSKARDDGVCCAFLALATVDVRYDQQPSARLDEPRCDRGCYVRQAVRAACAADDAAREYQYAGQRVGDPFD